MAKQPARFYITGGASAVLLNWRETTIDVDFTFTPENDELFRAFASIKESLRINLEMVTPAHFIPELPGWQDRSVFIATHGVLHFYHYDFYSQALAKIERGHQKDMLDVESMVRLKLVDLQLLRQLFGSIEGQLYKYISLNPIHFKNAVEDFIKKQV